MIDNFWEYLGHYSLVCRLFLDGSSLKSLLKSLLLLPIRILKVDNLSLQDGHETPEQFEEEPEEQFDNIDNHFYEPPENHREIFDYLPSTERPVGLDKDILFNFAICEIRHYQLVEDFK